MSDPLVLRDVHRDLSQRGRRAAGAARRRSDACGPARSSRWWRRRAPASRRCCISPDCWTGRTAARCWSRAATPATLPDAARTAIRRDTIGFVYQFHHLLAEFTALENVVLPQMIAGRPRRAAERRARRLLGVVRPGRPRCSICRASCRAASSSAWRSPARWPMQPKVLLADEPTGNLDVATAEMVFAELLRDGAATTAWRR